METGLAGRVAFVSGGSGPIGEAIALALASEGAAVAVTWHSRQDSSRRVLDAIKQRGGRGCTVELDQGNPDSVRAALDTVNDELGMVTVLVANAVAWPSREAEEIDALAESLAINTLGTARLIECALPRMRAANWGRIVVVSSDIVGQPRADTLAYATAKGALEAATRVLAVREARHGILTNVVRPGYTVTEAASVAESEFESSRTPTGRICTPADIASAVTYLGSEANGHVNGQTLSLAGGRELMR